jgi:hypothetical protein
MTKVCKKRDELSPTAQERQRHKQLRGRNRPKPSWRKRGTKPLTAKERRERFKKKQKEIEAAIAATAAINDTVSEEPCSLDPALQGVMTDAEQRHRKVVKKQDRWLTSFVYRPKEEPDKGLDTSDLESLYGDFLARKDDFDAYLAAKYANGDAPLASPRYLKASLVKDLEPRRARAGSHSPKRSLVPDELK